MLLMTRGPHQWVEVTDQRTGEVVMRMCVTSVKGSQVGLGFEAPLHILIMRDNAKTKEPKRNVDL